MSDYSELKQLAEAATPGKWCMERDDLFFYENGYTKHLMETAEGSDIDLVDHRVNLRFIAAANPDAVLALVAENEIAKMRIKELDLLFGRYILAMRAAVIEEEHGLGAEGAMMWIYNSLVGPGELPPENETLAQAYFDREIVAVDIGMQEVLAFHDALRAAKSVKP